MANAETPEEREAEESAAALELAVGTDAALAAANPSGVTPTATGSRFARNALLSIGRLLVSSVVALALPSYLTHKLPVKTYSAWILIIQMATYVNYLDLGIQAGISKFVAEYGARRDYAGSSMRASAGLALMLAASVLGVLLTIALAWRVPHIFGEMPATLYPEVRISLLFVGISLSFGLCCSAFSAIFLGMQRFGLPMAALLVNRLLFTAVIILAVSLHGSLATMGAAVAAVNVLTGILQVGFWKRYAGHIRVSLRLIDWAVLKEMLAYCSTLAIWTAGSLCVTGLDVTLVGRYDFSHTVYYALATLPTSFLVAILGAALAPLLPTASALSVEKTPLEMGEILSRATRYSTILLIVSSLPLLVGGYWILRLWVGSVYAQESIGFLRILVLANVVRNFCQPYSSMLVATGNQRIAIGGALCEAAVNVVASVLLVQHIGAIGVAYGTFLGSFVSVGMHFAVNMHFTYARFTVTRAALFFVGILRPLVVAIPSALLAGSWWRNTAPALTPLVWGAWAAGTSFLLWFTAFNAEERIYLLRMAASRLGMSRDTIG